MDAQSERQTSIYSPPFYSSPTGYKMRGRLYLHGDGNARRTHMSIFFVLMRGLNDSILKFPFNYKVTFCLYDQTNQIPSFNDCQQLILNRTLTYAKALNVDKVHLVMMDINNDSDR